MSGKRANNRPEGLNCYWFRLAPLHEQCKVTNTAVDFSPVGNPKTTITPAFVNHGLEMAPSFLPPAFPLTEGERLRYADAFQDRLRAAAEVSSPLEPKPKECQYCLVCKRPFRDYRTHIAHQDHRKAIRMSAFQKDIYKLARKMRKEREGRREEAGAGGHGQERGKAIAKAERRAK